MPSDKKPTKAQREWCRRLARPDTTLIESGRMFYSVRGPFGYSKPTWPLVAALEDGGLIAWREGPDPLCPARWVKTAELTATGRAAGGVSPTDGKVIRHQTPMDPKC